MSLPVQRPRPIAALAVKVVSAGGFVDATTPWTWADGDSLYITGVIEIEIT